MTREALAACEGVAAGIEFAAVLTGDAALSTLLCGKVTKLGRLSTVLPTFTRPDVDQTLVIIGIADQRSRRFATQGIVGIWLNQWNRKRV